MSNEWEISTDNTFGPSLSLHNEDDALAIENAIRAAVNTVMRVMCSACNRKVVEYQRMVADRDREIRRLECKLEKSESELEVLRVEVCSRQPEDELSCPVMSNDAREINCGEAVDRYDNSTKNEPCAVGAETPTQISPKCHDTAEAFPHQHAQAEMPSWEGEGAAVSQPFGCITSLVKEEPSDLEADIKWEVCEQGSLLDEQEGQRGAECQHEEEPAKKAFTCSPTLSGNSSGDFPDGTLPSSPVSSQSAPRCTTSTNADLYVDDSMTSSSNSDMIPSVLDNDWHFSFSIPWNIMPLHIKDTLKKQERPPAKDRREIIRLVVAAMLAVCKNPVKRHCTEIARRMVLTYPKSFKDVIDGQVVGSGYDSLSRQLQYRVDNCRRSQPMIMTQTSSGQKSKRRKTAYGSVNRDPCPVNLKEQRKKKELQRMFEKNDQDKNKIERLMMETFASQRTDVLHEKDTQTLKEEWPYLFSTTGLKTHFKQLTGVHIDEEFKETMSSKFKRVLRYFKCLNGERGSNAAKLLRDIHSANTSEESCAAVLMLLLHFKEDEGKMFVQVEDTCVSSEVRREDLPPTPCIVVCGDSPLTAAEFMVAVDQVVVMERISTFTSAMVCMFMMYYVMNIDYPAEVCSTLEFLQRCIFRINSGNGSKMDRHKKRKRLSVNPKVLSLIPRISECDWME